MADSELIEITDFYDVVDNLGIYELPIFADSNFKYNITINDKNFIFIFKWNNSMEFWSLEVYDQAEELLTTTKIVPNWNLYHNVQYLLDLTTPFLLSYNETDPYAYPTQFNMGDEHK